MLALILAAALHLLPPVLVSGERGWPLQERMRHYNATQVGIAVWRDGRIVETHDADALFQAGSISKTLTSVAVQRVLARESVPLNTDVNKLLRGWRLDEGAYAGQVTVERILSHTAGLNVPGFPGFEPGDPLPASLIDELEGRALTQPLRVESEPGKSPRYSGGGYALLQLMMNGITRRPFADVMRREVLQNAGMTHSTFAHEPRTVAGLTEDGEPIPRGGWIYPEQAPAGLSTTARDLARFVIALQTGKLLPPEATERMLDQRLGVFVIRKGKYFAHPGGNAGYYALFVASRTRADGVAILTNSELGDRLADEIVRGVAQKYGWEGYLPEPKQLVKIDVTPFAGRYRVDVDDMLTVRAEGDHLIAQRTAEKPFRLDAVGPNEFTRRDEDEQYVFRADQVTFGDVTAPRTNEGELPVSAYRTLNLSEEQLRARGIARKSLELLALNTELHPRSAAAWDALATAQLAAGDRAGARKSSRVVLDVLKDDWTATASWRVVYRKRALRRLR